jgi:Protein of unknown function (DUF3105)
VASKKRRRRSHGGRRPAAAGPGGTRPGDERDEAPKPEPRRGAAASSRSGRQARKQQAREAREAAERSMHRRHTIRRALTSAVLGVAIVGGFLFLTRVGGPRPIPAAAVEAAKTANCTGVVTPLKDAPGGQHLAPGQPYTYPSEPATSGLHAPSPLPADPAVYTEMQSETQLVHNLEHGFVVIYYRPDGDGALAQDVVDALTTYVDSAGHVLLSPHTSLPTGVALAMTYWNRVQTCPATITAGQATTVAKGFVTAFECSSVAPEASNC